MRAVVIEKPLSLRLSEAGQILATCRRRGLGLFVCHQLRFSSEFAQLKAAIETGEVGELQSLQAFCYGNLLDQGCHMVDTLRWLMGGREVRWVIAQGADELTSLARYSEIPADFKIDTRHPGPLWSHATFGFEGGLQATLSSGLLTAPTRPALGNWLQKRIVAVGSEGFAEAHAASHFRLINSKTPGGRVLRFGLQDYQDATLSFYRAILQTLRGEASDLQAANDALRSLETVLAALESIVDGSLVGLPLSERSDPLSRWREKKLAGPSEARSEVARLAAAKPMVSVILPMEDHRGMAIKAIESWVVKQRCPPEDFELIVLIDDSLRDLEHPVRELLRPHDQLIKQSAHNEMEQYDFGATQSKGEILLFTEPHCEAEPETISEVIHYFKTTSLDGLCARSTPVCRNRIGQMESRMYTDGFAEWSQPDDWRKVILRGFGIRRQAYFDAGGFQHRYSRFAEWLLAAALKSQGYQLGYAPGVAVSHLYADNLKLLDDFIREFTEGECLYRLETASKEFCESYFGAPAEWYEVRSSDRSLDFLFVATTLQMLVRRLGIARTLQGWITCLAQLVRCLASALCGKHLLLFKHQVFVWLAKLRCYFWWVNEERMYRAFVDYYLGATSLSRIRYGINNVPNKISVVTPRTSYSMEKMGDEEIFGFHGLETYQGEVFRWSSSVAALRLTLDPGNYRAVIRLISVRQLQPETELAIFWNHRPVRNLRFEPGIYTLEFSVTEDMFARSGRQCLILYCRPWTINGARIPDPRALGLPVVSVNFEPTRRHQ